MKYSNFFDETKPKTDFLHRSINLCVVADCGLSAALVYAYLRDWINFNEKHKVKKAFHDNQYWVYQTHDDIYEGLGHVIAKATIPKLTRELTTKGLLKKGDFNKIRSNRTNWYALGRPADEPPSGVLSAKSHEVIHVLTENRQNREAKKAEIKEKRKQAKIKELRPRRQEFIDELMAADYSNVPTGWGQYTAELCINTLSDENKLKVITEYVDFCIRHGNTPNFKHFTSQGMLDVYADRFDQEFN